MFRRFDLRLTATALAVALVSTGCLHAYIDPSLPTVGKADLVPASAPRPVQVRTEFVIDGETNGILTRRYAPRVVNVAKASGLFTAAGDLPVEGGDLMRVVFETSVTPEEPAAATFLDDNPPKMPGFRSAHWESVFACKVFYTHEGTTIVTRVEHGRYTTIGDEPVPAGLRPVPVSQALDMMVDQLTWNALNDLSHRQAFE
jgi:hypothetical protein